MNSAIEPITVFSNAFNTGSTSFRNWIPGIFGLCRQPKIFYTVITTGTIYVVNLSRRLMSCREKPR